MQAVVTYPGTLEDAQSPDGALHLHCTSEALLSRHARTRLKACVGGSGEVIEHYSGSAWGQEHKHRANTCTVQACNPDRETAVIKPVKGEILR